MLDLTDEHSSPDLWKEEDGSHYSDTLGDPESAEEIEEMTEEDEIVKSPK